MLVLYSSHEVDKAKDHEMKNWNDNNVFEEVEDNGERTLSLRWVITEKLKDGEKVVKARLVVRGFEEDTFTLRKDSPTCSREAVRLTFSIASSRKWKCHALDVKAAYLQGNQIEREVLVKPPPEYDMGKLWKLRKTVYGLSDAARAWYLRVKDELNSLGVKTSKYDSAMFSWHHGGHLQGILCVYVDDFLWAGTDEFYKKVVKNLENLFLIGNSSEGSFKYIGLHVDSEKTRSTIDQLDYASTLHPIQISCKRASMKTSNISEKERVEYRSLVGQLNWIGTQTRPDILFDVCDLSSSVKSATINDILRLNKVVSRLKGSQVKILFPPMDNLESCYLEVYTDASFGNLSAGGSQVGLLILLKSPSGKRCPIYWQSKKARRVVKSTLAAETMALC